MAKNQKTKKVDIDKFVARKLSVLNTKGNSKKAQNSMARVIKNNKGVA